MKYIFIMIQRFTNKNSEKKKEKDRERKKVFEKKCITYEGKFFFQKHQ